MKRLLSGCERSWAISSSYRGSGGSSFMRPEGEVNITEWPPSRLCCCSSLLSISLRSSGCIVRGRRNHYEKCMSTGFYPSCDSWIYQIIFIMITWSNLDSIFPWSVLFLDLTHICSLLVPLAFEQWLLLVDQKEGKTNATIFLRYLTRRQIAPVMQSVKPGA